MTVHPSTSNSINLNIYNSTYHLKGHLDNSQQSIVQRKPCVYKTCLLRS